MAEKKISIQKYAMRFGTLMGLYWIFKFVFLPLGIKIPFLFLLFVVMTIAVPFLGYKYTRMFRDKVLNGTITFVQAFIFTTFMYIFASLLVAVAHYVYFQYLDNGFMLEMTQTLSKSMNFSEVEARLFDENINALRNDRPIDLTLKTIYSNISTGGFLAIPTALFVMRKPTNNTNINSGRDFND